jgi:5'-nucleotidase
MAMDFVHGCGDLKRITMENLDHYVVKDERLPLLLDRMHENNRKVFLLTNSGYEYTDTIMGFLLNDEKKNINWKTYFDYILVDAKKPLFFAEGTSLKQIDNELGIKKFGIHAGPLKRNHVYSGGNCDTFSELIGSRGKDVLYVGDHIFGDIIKSKKERAWRTFLVVPELAQETNIWNDRRNNFSEIERLDKVLAKLLM